MVDLQSALHGPNSKLFVAGGGIAVFLVVWEYRKSAKAGSPAAIPAGDPAAVPTTDYSSDGSSYDYSPDTSSLFGYVDPSTGATITGGAGNSGTGTGGPLTGPTTNAQWSQQVQAMLIQQGYESAVVGTALGHFIAGTAMTPAQYDVVLTGIALEGKPPQPVPSVHITPKVVVKPNLDGYYVLNPARTHWQVQAGICYHVLGTTVVKMRQAHQEPVWRPVLINNPIFKLPRGRNV